jgi:putative transcription factor
MSSSSSFCELCGRRITDGKKTVLIDGSIFNVCISCSKRGKPYVPSMPGKASSNSIASSPKSSLQRTSKIQMADETLLNRNFGNLIREARMKKGWTHEQLGKIMNEKATLLRKFETGTLKPDELSAKKLGRFLGIKLYEKIEDEEN